MTPVGRAAAAAYAGLGGLPAVAEVSAIGRAIAAAAMPASAELGAWRAVADLNAIARRLVDAGVELRAKRGWLPASKPTEVSVPSQQVPRPSDHEWPALPPVVVFMIVMLVLFPAWRITAEVAPDTR